MTKEVKKIIHNSLQGGSSLFNMNFATDGLSWVKGICQSFETSCNEYVDACNKYVNTAGEQINRIYEDVCEWENPPDAEGPISSSHLKHDTMANVSNESSVDLVKDSSSEKPSACDQRQLINVSIPEDSDLVALSNESQSQGHGMTCDGDSGELLSTGAPYSSDDSGENCKETLDTFASPADPTSSTVPDCIQLLESHHDGEPSTNSIYVPSEVNGSSEDTVESCGNESNDNGKQIGAYKLETSGLFKENDIAEVSDGREDFTSSTAKLPDQNLQTEEFEAIKVEDFWDDAEKDEVALSSHRGDKNMSLKEKLRNAFVSRKGCNWANYQYESNDTIMVVGRRLSQGVKLLGGAVSSVPGFVSASSVLTLSSGQESIESEWELL